jgi:hypothetical protein
LSIYRDPIYHTSADEENKDSEVDPLTEVTDAAFEEKHDDHKAPECGAWDTFPFLNLSFWGIGLPEDQEALGNGTLA